MARVQRSAAGMREAMFEVLDQLREGKISQRQAKAQMEAVKTVCMTLAYERQEVQLIKEQIELDEKMKVIEGKASQKQIEHGGVNDYH